MGMKMSAAGGCLCGDIRYRADAEPLWICHCHCEKCRKQTGSAVATYVGFPAGSVTWLAAEPTRYRSSNDVERSFCPTCGSTIGFHRVHETSLALGSFDTPAALLTAGVWTGHVWFKEHIGWFDTADDWTRYETFPQWRAEALASLSGQQIRG